MLVNDTKFVNRFQQSRISNYTLIDYEKTANPIINSLHLHKFLNPLNE